MNVKIVGTNQMMMMVGRTTPNKPHYPRHRCCSPQPTANPLMVTQRPTPHVPENGLGVKIENTLLEEGAISPLALSLVPVQP